MEFRSVINSENRALNDAYTQWLEWDKNAATRKQILELAEHGKFDELEKLLLHRIEFGTAGLRATMAAGNSQMNDLTVIQAAQGLSVAVESSITNAHRKGVVIGYDHRKNKYGCSEIFAKLSAAILLNRGFKVYMFGRVVCTPLVPFAVTKYGAAAGVMVTASHNPKNDNGYKVYWGNGAQIIPPYDQIIASAISQNLKPWFDVWASLDTVNERVVNIFDDCVDAYISACAHTPIGNCSQSNADVAIVYTAMHGVGLPFVEQLFRKCSLPTICPVLEQSVPDADFPTVAFPNPEEGKSALDMAMKLADLGSSRYILANDPDADRLAVAEKMPGGQWHVFKGNEIGSLFAWWVWHCHQQLDSSLQPKKCAMIASTVSSKFIQAMAAVEGFRFEETLTGFKWMGNRALELLGEDTCVLLAYEEAIGFMIGTTVLDKDGVHAAATMARMMCYLEREGKSLHEQLDDLYKKYGFFVSNDSYFICSDPCAIAAIFQAIRPTYPKAIGPFALKAVRDMTIGYDSRYSDLKARLPSTPEAQMVTFYFENNAVVTVRGSGTEPKLKYYSELSGPLQDDRSKVRLAKQLEEIIKAVVVHFLQPDKHGLQPRPS